MCQPLRFRSPSIASIVAPAAGTGGARVETQPNDRLIGTTVPRVQPGQASGPTFPRLPPARGGRGKSPAPPPPAPSFAIAPDKIA